MPIEKVQMIEEERKNSAFLRSKEIPGAQIPSPLVFATCDDNFYLYFCVNGCLYSFDSETQVNNQLPSSFAITSRVSCVAISPQHTLAAAGYEDGSVQLFDIISNKSLKGVSRIGSGKISRCTFVGDSSLVILDASLNLTHLSISNSIFGFQIKDSLLTTFNTFASALIAPPCYKYVDGIPQKKVTNQAHCTAPSFAQCVTIALFNKVVVTNVSPQGFVLLTEFEAERPLVAVSLPTPDTLLVAFTTTGAICVRAVAADGSTTDVVERLTLKAAPQCISFLSPTLLVIVNEDFTVSVLSFSGGTTPNVTTGNKEYNHNNNITNIDDNNENVINDNDNGSNKKGDMKLFFRERACKVELRGFFMVNNDNLKIMTPKTIFSFSLLSFFDQVAAFRADDDLVGCVAFCKRALDNDPDAVIGLESGATRAQRSLVIEHTISPFLSENVTRRLQQRASNPTTNITANNNVATNVNNGGGFIDNLSAEVIELSKELCLEEWIIKDAPPIFQSNAPAALKTLVGRVVEADPEAKFFSYNAKFVELVLEHCRGRDLSAFLCSLPTKVCRPPLLLRYAQQLRADEARAGADVDSKSVSLATEVFLKRTNDTIGALNVFESVGDTKSICNVLLGQHTLDAEIIRWIFAAKKIANGLCFPRLRTLFQLNKNKNEEKGNNEGEDGDVAIEILQKMINLSEKELPFSINNFINAILSVFLEIDVSYNSPLYKLFEDFLLYTKFSYLSQSSIRFLLSKIFTSDFAQPDNREALVLTVLQNLNFGCSEGVNCDQSSNKNLASRKTSFVSDKFALSLIPLCQAFGFDRSKQIINQKLRQIKNIFQEVINDDVNDTFAWINKNLTNETKDDILAVIFANADRLLTMDPLQMITILQNQLDDKDEVPCVMMMLKHIKNIEMKYFYIHSLLKIGYLKLDYLNSEKDNKNYNENNQNNEDKIDIKKLTIDSIPFLCKYFPDDLFKIIENIDFQINRTILFNKDNENGKYFILNVLSDCEENGISDSCSLICQKLFNLLNKTNGKNKQNKFSRILNILLIKKLLKFTRELIVKELINHHQLILKSIDFVVDKLSIINSNNEILSDDEYEYEEEEDVNSDDENDNEIKGNMKDIENEIQSIEKAVPDLKGTLNYKRVFEFTAKSFVLPLFECAAGSETDEICSIFGETCGIFNEKETTRSVMEFEDIVHYSHSLFMKIGKDKFPRLLRCLILGRNFDANQTQQMRNVIVKAIQKEDKLFAITCARCKLRLFVEETPIIILKCGHAIHNTKFCTKNLDKCPICFDE